MSKTHLSLLISSPSLSHLTLPRSLSPPSSQNQFDTIDLSDNGIVRVDGFPKLPRLRSLHLNNNKISKIVRNLELALPNLEWLILTNNKLANFSDLESLRTLPKLRFLSLIDNPVTRKQGYRLFIIARCPRLKVLDFKKVKLAEREEARKVHGDNPPIITYQQEEEKEKKEGEEEETGKRGVKRRVNGEETATIRKGPTEEDMLRIKAAIANASTIEEIKRLEEALQSGQMPEGDKQEEEEEQGGPSDMEQG
jgi:U2 small nuclear ribonucleoprotein A'